MRQARAMIARDFPALITQSRISNITHCIQKDTLVKAFVDAVLKHRGLKQLPVNLASLGLQVFIDVHIHHCLNCTFEKILIMFLHLKLDASNNLFIA